MRNLSKWQKITLMALNSLCNKDTERYFDIFNIIDAVEEMNGLMVGDRYNLILKSVRALYCLDLIITTHVNNITLYRVNDEKAKQVATHYTEGNQ